MLYFNFSTLQNGTRKTSKWMISRLRLMFPLFLQLFFSDFWRLWLVVHACTTNAWIWVSPIRDNPSFSSFFFPSFLECFTGVQLCCFRSFLLRNIRLQKWQLIISWVGFSWNSKTGWQKCFWVLIFSLFKWRSEGCDSVVTECTKRISEPQAASSTPLT